jgi:hypothetical protein
VMLVRWLVSLVLAAAAPSAADAFCYHDRTLYAKTTLAQEFRESRWVVRARVEGGRYYFGQPTSWTLYRMRLLHAFKGEPEKQFTFYTRRDSSGFYMDAPSGRADVGHDYLLFLIPMEVASDDPRLARGAMWVNYACGMSGPWAELTREQKTMLRTLERGRP